MRTFQIPITLSDEEIETLKKLKSGVPKDWDSFGESENDHYHLCKLPDLKLIHLDIRTKYVSLTIFGKEILKQL